MDLQSSIQEVARLCMRIEAVCLVREEQRRFMLQGGKYVDRLMLSM